MNKQKWRVFRLTDRDLVAHYDLQSAKQWFVKQSGLPEEQAIEENYVCEMDLEKDGLFYKIEEVEESDVKKAENTGKWKVSKRNEVYNTKMMFYYENIDKEHITKVPKRITHVWVSFARAIELIDLKEPCHIAGIDC